MVATRANAERDPRASREREVQRRDEDGDGGRCHSSVTAAPTVCDDTGDENHTHRRQQPEGVPVPERPREPIRVERIVRRAEVIRDEARRETVGDDKHDSDGRTRQNGRPVAAAKDERYRERDRNVDERPLDLANRGGALIDQTAESPIQTASATMSAANATRSRPGTSTRSRMRSTVVGTRKASATQPHDCEKYAP